VKVSGRIISNIAAADIAAAKAGQPAGDAEVRILSPSPASAVSAL
jgi:hypothetical protein